MTSLRFDVANHRSRIVDVSWVFNAGFSGRDTAQVKHDLDVLAGLGGPTPANVPTLHPLNRLLARQERVVQVPHARTSGAAEWALVVGEFPEDLMVTAACGHTDRDLEVHGLAWSKQAAPDLVGQLAWRWSEVADDFDSFSLRAWVTHDGSQQLIADGSPAEVLSPSYWIERLGDAGLLRPGTLLLGGAISMTAGVDQFAEGWRVELTDPAGHASRVAYRVEQLTQPWV